MNAHLTYIGYNPCACTLKPLIENLLMTYSVNTDNCPADLNDRTST